IKRTHGYQSSVTGVPVNIFAEPRPSYRRRIEFGEPTLMPIWISQRGGAGGIEPGDLVRCQLPANRAQILAQLFFVARTYDDAGNTGPLQQPVQRNLRHRFAGLAGNFIQSIDHLVDLLVGNRRSLVIRELALQTGGWRQRLSSSEFSSQLAPAERTPDD